MLKLTDPDETNRTVPLFRLAFRPFFLGGVLFSLLALSLWAVFWITGLDWVPYGGWIWWHAHEMLYGFVVAIIIGFLLTAVQNWTGQESITGWPLAGLFTLWLLPRGLLLYPVAAVESLLPWMDLAFLPVAAWVMGRLLWRARQFVNLAFVPILLLLTVANAQMHWAVVQGDAVLFRGAAESAIFIIVLVMVVMGGRVIPFFTANGTATPRVLPNPVIELLSLGSVALLALLHLFGLIQHLSSLLVSAIFMVAGLAHLLRFLRWRPWITYKEPLLWSLHLAYLFIALGFILCALRFAGLSLDVLSRFTALYPTILHSFTLGGMGLLILAMMSRVSLGHTGRPLVVSLWVSFSFLCIIAAYVSRVWLPLLSPATSHYSSYLLSIIFWLSGYGLFVFVYLPVLSTPRVDGQMG
ncbi:MAG: NnrS family protein [Gammaproteobacteria bacterium]